MKKTLLTLIILISTLYSSSINWEKDYNQAVLKAKQQNKKLFIMVSSPTCPECNYMKKKVFTKNKIKTYINKNYISFQFLHKSKDIPKQMQFWGIPRFYFSKDGKNVTNKVMGGLKEKKLLSILKKSI